MKFINDYIERIIATCTHKHTQYVCKHPVIKERQTAVKRGITESTWHKHDHFNIYVDIELDVVGAYVWIYIECMEIREEK